MYEKLLAAQRWLWNRRHENVGARASAACLRVAFMVGRDFASGHLSLRAMSLVYTTLLSLVPMLALSFSMFKAMGVHNAMEPAVRNFLAPLGEQAESITKNIIGFVENIDVGVLGSLGVGLLLYAAISLIQKVEASFNWVWRIDRPRSIGARFSEYLSVLIVGPFAVFLSVGITASALNSSVVQDLASVEPLGTLIFALTKLVPYLIIIGVFTFLYAFIPNARVPLRAALGGGVLAGVLWQTASLGFASFVASSGNYNAVYSGFAIVIFLLIWLYVGWLILLLGCQLSFYLAHPECVQRHPRDPQIPPRRVEKLGFAIVAETARRHLDGGRHATRNELAKLLMAPSEDVDPVINTLITRGVLAETAEVPPKVLSARDPQSLRVGELWQLLREDRSDAADQGIVQDVAPMRKANETLLAAEGAFDANGGSQTLRQWLQSGRDSG